MEKIVLQIMDILRKKSYVDDGTRRPFTDELLLAGLCVTLAVALRQEAKEAKTRHKAKGAAWSKIRHKIERENAANALASLRWPGN